jgi:hypothetical protein
MNNQYQEKLQHLHESTIPWRMYTFEVTKCCGASQFVVVYKRLSLAVLHESVQASFNTNQYGRLFLVGRDRMLIEMPYDGSIPLNQFISRNLDRLVPVYPFPHPVVYEIVIDAECSSCENRPR